MTFGTYLKNKLKKHRITQQELAKQICVSENTITSWTTDRREPSIRNFLWCCRYIAMLDKTEFHQIVDEAGGLF